MNNNAEAVDAEQIQELIDNNNNEQLLQNGIDSINLLTSTQESEINEFANDEDIATHANILKDYFLQMNESALTHVGTFKRTLVEKYQLDLLAQRNQFEDTIRQQQSDLEELSEELASRTKKDSETIQHLMTVSVRFSTRHVKMNEYHNSRYFATQIFFKWAAYAKQVRGIKHTLKNKLDLKLKLTLAKHFSIFQKQFFRQTLLKQERHHQHNLQAVRQSIDEVYTAEIKVLKAQLSDAHLVIKQELGCRQQMEEELRRMFLKNMTVLNMEALTLFQNPEPTPGANLLSSTTVANNTSHSATNSTGSTNNLPIPPVQPINLNNQINQERDIKIFSTTTTTSNNGSGMSLPGQSPHPAAMTTSGIGTGSSSSSNFYQELKQTRGVQNAATTTPATSAFSHKENVTNGTKSSLAAATGTIRSPTGPSAGSGRGRLQPGRGDNIVRRGGITTVTSTSTTMDSDEFPRTLPLQLRHFTSSTSVVASSSSRK